MTNRVLETLIVEHEQSCLPGRGRSPVFVRAELFRCRQLLPMEISPIVEPIDIPRTIARVVIQSLIREQQTERTLTRTLDPRSASRNPVALRCRYHGGKISYHECSVCRRHSARFNSRLTEQLELQRNKAQWPAVRDTVARTDWEEFPE